MKKYTVQITATHENEVMANSKREAEELYMEEISLTDVLRIDKVKVHKWGKDV
jgi:hypothetical protein